MTAETSNAREPDVAMALHWIDRYAAGIDDECQIDLVADALGVTLPDGYATAPQPADARGDVRGLVDGVRRLSERWKSREIDGEPVSESKHMQLAGCAAMLDSLLDNYALAAEGAQPEPKPVLSEPNRIGLYQGPDDCPQLMVNDRAVAIFPAGSWAKVCDALDSITGSVHPEPKAEAGDVVDEGSRSVTNQLLHWGGIPVRVTGTVTTSPGNWPLIDATLTGERNG